MSAPFTTTLRAAPGTIRLGQGGDGTLAIRVQVPELWETLRVDAAPDTTVSALKERVLAAVMAGEEAPEDYLVKLGGWEVLDENAGLAAAGARQGSILVVTGRRRRPVR